MQQQWWCHDDAQIKLTSKKLKGDYFWDVTTTLCPQPHQVVIKHKVWEWYYDNNGCKTVNKYAMVVSSNARMIVMMMDDIFGVFYMCMQWIKVFFVFSDFKMAECK